MDNAYLGKQTEQQVEERVAIVESEERPVMSGAVVKDALTEETLPIARYLGINDHPTDDETGKLSYIVAWLKGMGITDRGDMLSKIKSEEIKIGEPTLGEKRINVLYRVLRLNSEIDSKVKELMAYQRGSHV